MAQRRKSISHGRELYYILFIVALVMVGAFSIWGPDGYMKMKDAERGLQTSRARLEALQRSNSERMRSIQALKYDKRAVEDYARTKGYGKKGEIIQHLPEQPASK